MKVECHRFHYVVVFASPVLYTKHGIKYVYDIQKALEELNATLEENDVKKGSDKRRQRLQWLYGRRQNDSVGGNNDAIRNK